MGNAFVGAAVHSALPTSISTIALLSVQFRPKTSAICAQQGMKAADGRLNAETIQLSCENSPKSPAIHGSALAILLDSQPWSAVMYKKASSYMVESRACSA